MTLREYISFWQETYDKHQSRPTTYAAHNYVFKNHILPGLGDIPLSELTSEMVGEFLEERKRFGNHRRSGFGLGEETMRHIHRLLQQCLDQTIRDGLLTENPAKAFKKLEKFVAGIIDAEATVDAKIDALAKIENIVHNNCTIIFIDSKTRESAYKLFQVLNDRGAGLTEGDLLKSKTLEVLEKHFSIKQSTVQDAWDEILQDEPKQIEQFLRYYYASVCGSRVGRTSLYDDFLKQFFPDIVDVDDVSDEATATKIVDTVNQILREIRTYRKLIAGIWPYEVGQPLTDWDRKRLDILIRFLDFDIVYPLLLAAVQLKQKTFADLVHMLEKFMFRHKSVCNLGHQKLSELYMQEAVKIRRDPENYRLTGLRTTLKEYIETECTDAVFKVGLSNLKYRTNGGNKPLRYLFSTLNEHIEWYRNGAVGAPAPQKGTVINYDNVTIEHIASQSPSAAVPGFTSENIHILGLHDFIKTRITNLPRFLDMSRPEMIKESEIFIQLIEIGYNLSMEHRFLAW